MAKQRPTLRNLMAVFAHAAMDCVAAASDAFRARWEKIEDRELTVNVGDGRITVPASTLEPDAFPYPKSLKFKTKIRVEAKKDDVEIVNGGSLFRTLQMPCEVEIKFTFGAVPEGYALQREHDNSQLANKLDQL